MIVNCNFAAPIYEYNSFHILVRDNPTTGYHWEVSDESYGVNFINQNFISDNPNLSGSGGISDFVFKVSNINHYYVKLVLISPSGEIADYKDSNNFIGFKNNPFYFIFFIS